MKLHPLFHLTAGIAAVGISSGLFLLSGTVGTDVSSPHQSIRTGPLISSPAPGIAGATPVLAFYGERHEQPFSSAVITGRLPSSDPETRSMSRPQLQRRELSSGAESPRREASFQPRHVRSPTSGEGNRESPADLTRRLKAQNENEIMQKHSRPSILVNVFQQGRVASSDVEEQKHDGSVDVSARTGLKPPRLPAVLVPPASDGKMTEIQATEWDKLEQKFVADIGGPDQSPSDPEYWARWQSAQDISDVMFRQKFGTEAFLRFNTEAGRRSE